MELTITPKSAQALYPTDILFQTSFWGNVKRKLGWEVFAFDFSTARTVGDVLVLTQHINDKMSIAYVPQGPESTPEADGYGKFLERLSESIAKYLAPSSVFIRYDLPWPDPSIAGQVGKSHAVKDFCRPRSQLREIKMNCSTDNWNLRKSPFDLTVADSLVIDLLGSEDEILAAMKTKTRYNIHLAQRKGVTVIRADVSSLPIFYDLYLQTAKRNGFSPCGYNCFSALFDPEDREDGAEQTDSPELFFYLACCRNEVLSGAIVSVSLRTAAYLFGASSNSSRNLMGSYALQWRVIRDVRNLRCHTYDMGAITASKQPAHPFYGMYRFKTGFGGRVVHRVGSWDYPLDQDRYEQIRNAEFLML